MIFRGMRFNMKRELIKHIYADQEAFGGNTTLPWGMTGDIIQAGAHINSTMGVEGFDPSLPVHPTFLYESIWNILVFVFLLWLAKQLFTREGEVALSYLMLYSAGRFVIESFRTDSLMLGPLRMAQVISLCLLLGAFLVLLYRRKTGKGQRKNI